MLFVQSISGEVWDIDKESRRLYLNLDTDANSESIEFVWNNQKDVVEFLDKVKPSCTKKEYGMGIFVCIRCIYLSDKDLYVILGIRDLTDRDWSLSLSSERKVRASVKDWL